MMEQASIHLDHTNSGPIPDLRLLRSDLMLMPSHFVRGRRRFHLGLTWLFSWAFCATVFADYQPVEFDVALRKLMRSVVMASIQPESQRVSAMRRALLENADVVADAITASDPQLLADAIGPVSAVEVTGFEAAVLQRLIQTGKSVLKQDPSHQFEEILVHSIPDSALHLLSNVCRNQLEKFRPSEHPALKHLLSPETGISVRDPSLQKLVQTYLPRYFDNQSVEDKGRYAAAILDLPPDAPMEDKLASLMQSSNVLLQKLMQLFGKDVQSPVLMDALLKLQNGVKPFPTSVAKAIIESRTGRRLAETFSEFSEEPIAAGTVGQVYRATLRSTGEVVIVKVRRPDALESIERDVTVLLRIIDDPAVRGVISRAAEVVRAEGDFRIEAKYLEEGEIYVDLKRGLSVASRHPEFKPAEDLIVTRLAPGKNLANLPYEGETLRLRGKAVEQLLRKWFQEAMFGQGFFHGDLHPGNLFLDKAVERDMGFLLTLIDFGNSGRLTLSERQSFAKIAASVVFGDVNGIVTALSQLDPHFPSQNLELLRTQLSQLRDPRSGLFNANVAKTMEVAGRAGVQVSSAIVAFSRAEMFLAGELDRINAALEKASPGSSRFDKMAIYKSVGLQSIWQALPWKPQVLSGSVLLHAARSSCVWLMAHAKLSLLSLRLLPAG